MSPPSSTASSTAAPSIHIEPLHNPGQVAMTVEPKIEMGHGKMGLGAKGFLMKKMAATGQSFCSPTDTMVSPCTQKLVQSKKRHYMKGKPLSLSKTFQSSQLGSQLVPGSPQLSLAEAAKENMADVSMDMEL